MYSWVSWVVPEDGDYSGKVEDCSGFGEEADFWDVELGLDWLAAAAGRKAGCS